MTLPLSRESNPLRCSAHETSIQLCNLVGYANASNYHTATTMRNKQREKFHSASSRGETREGRASSRSNGDFAAATAFSIHLFFFFLFAPYRLEDLEGRIIFLQRKDFFVRPSLLIFLTKRTLFGSFTVMDLPSDRSTDLPSVDDPMVAINRD